MIMMTLYLSLRILSLYLTMASGFGSLGYLKTWGQKVSKLNFPSVIPVMGHVEPSSAPRSALATLVKYHSISLTRTLIRSMQSMLLSLR